MKRQNLSLDSVVVASKDQVSCDLEGEAAILNLKTGAYYGLNPIGARIWQLIQTPKRVPEIVDTLVPAYEVDPKRCQSDIVALLQDLISDGLAEVQS